MTAIIIWFSLSALLALIADGRGRSPVVFFLLAVLASPPVALIILLFTRNRYAEAIEQKKRIRKIQRLKHVSER